MAYGPVGLDFSDNSAGDIQIAVLMKFVSMVYQDDFKRPLVLVCRDRFGRRGAFYKTMKCLTDCLSLKDRKRIRILFSCFNYGMKEFKLFIEHFPNTYFGISPRLIIEDERHPELEKVISQFNDAEFVLESYSPKLRLPVGGKRPSTPNVIMRLAERI